MFVFDHKTILDDWKWQFFHRKRFYMIFFISVDILFSMEDSNDQQLHEKVKMLW